MALGIPDQLYDALTPPELETLVSAFGERERRREYAAWRRVALLVAEMRNMMRSKPSQKVWTMDDIVPPLREPGDAPVKEVSFEQFVAVATRWAKAHNAYIERKAN